MTPFNIFLVILFGTFATSMQKEQSFLLKDAGKISFFENEKVLKYEVDLTNYYRNAEVFQNTTNELSIVCNELNNKKDCEYFVNTYREHVETVKNNIQLIETNMKNRHRRSFKRFAGGTAKQIVQNAVIYYIFDKFFGSSDDISEKQLEVERKFEVKQMELERKQLQAQKQWLNDSSQKAELDRLEDEKYNKYLYTLNVVQMLFTSHLKDTANYKGLMGKELKTTFFNVITFDKFINDTIKANEDLHPLNLMIPDLKVWELLQISRMESQKNKTHILITVNLPIIPIYSFSIFEYVPIPFMQNNETLILNINSGRFYKNNSNVMILPGKDNEHCSEIKDWTFCNTLAIESMDQSDQCIHSLLLKDEITSNCQYKVLQNKNYVVDISPYSTYCYILDPLLLKITCEDSTTVHNLTSSGEIFYEEKCIKFVAVDYVEYRGDELVSEVSYEFFMPNFTIFDTKNRNWTNNVEIINKYMIRLDEFQIESKEMEKEYIKSFKSNSDSTFWGK